MSGLSEGLRDWVNAGLSFFFPEICQVCRKHRAGPADGFVCGECQAKVKWIRPPWCERCGEPVAGAITNAFVCSYCREEPPYFDWARGAVGTAEPVLDLIHRYKYHRALWAEPFLAGLLIAAARPTLAAEPWDAIVPVPLHPTRQREREFNQAERLARRLGRACALPVDAKLLRRVLYTRTQTTLTREERQANVRKAFALRTSGSLAGRRLVLVDDVLTTGATTNACARVLRDAGAAKVCVWTVARGLRVS
jgi:ComF family protein